MFEKTPAVANGGHKEKGLAMLLPNHETLAYRLGLTLDLMGEEMERGPAADRERMEGLLRMARADATAMGGGAFERDDGDKKRASARRAFKLVHGGRQD